MARKSGAIPRRVFADKRVSFFIMFEATQCVRRGSESSVLTDNAGEFSHGSIGRTASPRRFPTLHEYEPENTNTRAGRSRRSEAIYHATRDQSANCRCGRYAHA